MPIKKLPPMLANQISAGEVVERPASVIKELIENSVDAGSTQIEVTVEGAGLGLLQVVDNGTGIPPEQMQLALERHATSKLSTTEDLLAIGSLGFRGEALASIAAVSHFSLTSATSNEKKAWQLSPPDTICQPAALAKGTCIRVEDLFYNVPARRKFLKSDRTETAHIESIVKRQALAFPEIAFTLKIEGKLIWQLPAAKNERLKRERLKKFFGKAFSDTALFIDERRGDLALKGWLAPPELARRQPDRQLFYINQRSIKDKVISHAINSVHQALIQNGFYPSYCLFLSLPLDSVDVNVHPTKHEVRFRQAKLIHDFIQLSIEKALGQEAPPVPAYTPKSAPLAFKGGAFIPEPEIQAVEAEHSSVPFSQIIGNYRFFQEGGLWYLINCQKAASLLPNNSQVITGHSKALLFPETLQLTQIQWHDFDAAQTILLEQGWQCREMGPQHLVITHIPEYFPQKEIAPLFKQCIKMAAEGIKNPLPTQVITHLGAEKISENLTEWIASKAAIRITDKHLETLC